MQSRSDIMAAIAAERERQFNLPGSERDVRNTPNDFIAIATRYLGEEARRFDNLPSRAEWEKSLIKAAAVIVAALESAPAMQEMGHFADSAPDRSFALTLMKVLDGEDQK